MVDGKGKADEEGKNCCGFAYGRLCIFVTYEHMFMYFIKVAAR